MSKEYIEREAALKITDDLKDDDNSRFYNVALSDVRTELMALTTADVKPVQHGKWIDTDTFDFHCVHIYQCSNCGKEVADDYIDNHKFCLHCGATMDGGNSNE